MIILMNLIIMMLPKIVHFFPSKSSTIFFLFFIISDDLSSQTESTAQCTTRELNVNLVFFSEIVDAYYTHVQYTLESMYIYIYIYIYFFFFFFCQILFLISSILFS